MQGAVGTHPNFVLEVRPPSTEAQVKHVGTMYNSLVERADFAEQAGDITHPPAHVLRTGSS